MPVAKFVCFDILGSLLYGMFYVELGFVFSGEVTGVLAWLSALGWRAVVLAVLAMTIFAGYRYAHRNRNAAARPVSNTVGDSLRLPKEQIC